MTQVLQWMQSPTELSGIKDFAPWKEKCDVKGQPYCSLPNACALTTRELPGETIRLVTQRRNAERIPAIQIEQFNDYNNQLLLVITYNQMIDPRIDPRINQKLNAIRTGYIRA